MGSSAIRKRLDIILSVNDAATARLTRAQRVMRAFGHTTTNASGALSKFGRRFMQVGRALVSFLIIRTVTVQLANFVKTLFTANEAVEKITASMKVLGGSLAYAQRAMDFVREIATRAPFHMEAIASAGQKLMAYGKDLEKWIPALLDWAAAFNATSGELDMWAAAMGKVLAMSPYIKRILINRGVDYKQWNEALSQTNQELSKEAQYSEALMIVLGRFKGQAAELAKTMSGLRTNIHDVWMELSREVGLGAFTAVRSELFDFYGDLKTLVTEQKVALWDIGDILGNWATRIILVIRKLADWRRGLGVIKTILSYIGKVILGKVIIGFLLSTYRMIISLGSLLGGPVMLAVVAIAFIVGQFASHFIRAKVRALDLEIAMGQVAAGAETIAEFWERTEKVLSRIERQIMRQLLIQLNGMYVGISRARTEMKALAEKDLDTLLQGLKGWDRTFQESSIKIFFSQMRRGLASMKDFARAMPGTFERLVLHVNAVRDAADQWGPLMPEEWNAQLQETLRLGDEMMAPGAIFDADKVNTFYDSVENLTGALFEQAGAVMQIDQATRLAAEKREREWLDVTKYMEEMTKDMERYRLNAEGIAGHEGHTTEFMRQRLAYGKDILEDTIQQGKWAQWRNEIEGDTLKKTTARLKVRAEAFESLKEEWEYTLRIAQLRATIADDSSIYAAALNNVVVQIQALQEQPMMFTPAEWKQLEESLLVTQAALAGLKTTQDELAFSTYAAFTLWQQALNPVVSAVGAITDGAKAMGEAFGNAMKQMLKWAMQLIAQLLVMVILMSIFKLASGGDVGWLGAMKAIMGGGVESIPDVSARAFGTRGPELAFAGGGITPRAQSDTGRGGDVHIHMEDSVVLDGESFMRMVDDANFKLEKRKGGGR